MLDVVGWICSRDPGVDVAGEISVLGWSRASVRREGSGGSLVKISMLVSPVGARCWVGAGLVLARLRRRTW